MKKVLSVFLAFLIALTLSACTVQKEHYASGVPSEPIGDENELALARYENMLYGIILEYPEAFTRTGNLDVDGKISFAGDDIEIFLYIPDKAADLRLTTEEYALDVLGLYESPDAGTVTYGKTTGYRTFSRAGGRVHVQFVAKGLDGFYRFDYLCPEARFNEGEPPFSAVMSSIRIDDGKFTFLNRMLAEYMILLEYPSSMQYVTDANYASHCLNTYTSSRQETYLDSAKNSFLTIKQKLEDLLSHTPGDDKFFADLWLKVSSYAEETIEACDLALAAIDKSDIETAQRISRINFTYDLSDAAENFLDAIQTEIGEY